MSIFDKYDLIDVDESFPIPDIPESGLIFIYGNSGTGKTTILKNIFGENKLLFDDRPIYKNFSSEENAEKFLISCGLRTIPSWRRAFNNLSNGEKHRAECALSLDKGIEYIDEFTSVVDRDTAKSLSYAIQKWFRNSGIKRLVIASCHKDIIEWLNPDSIYNTDIKRWEKQSIARGLLQRPKIQLRIVSADGKYFWEVFKKYHYLSGKLNYSSASFVAFLNSKPIAFCSILRFPNGNFKNAWREHRTVVLPEFQGLGIGKALSNEIAKMVVDNGGRFFSKTSHPAFGIYRDKSPLWRPTSKNHKKRNDYTIKKSYTTKEDGHKMKHYNRMCYSHEYIGVNNAVL